MDDNTQKKGIFKAQFNSLNINEQDPTILRGKVIVHDFEQSWNNQIITEEICAENMSTLIGKRIVCKYIPSENNNGIDALTDHEETIIKDRNTQQEVIGTDTIAIGFIENAYIDDFVDENNNTKRVLFADVVIWNDDKYRNIVGLLQEWIQRGVKIHMSVEYLYMNYNKVDGVEYLQSPILYVAHTLLNSEQRGNVAEVLPAFDSAQLLSLNDKKSWNKAINSVIKQDDTNLINNKEDDNLMKENIFLKSLNAISLGDTRDKIHSCLKKQMSAEEYEYVWVSTYSIFPEEKYFVYETYENGAWVNYKVPYEVQEESVVVQLDKKEKAELKQDWIAMDNYQKSQNSLNDKEEELVKVNEKITELEKELNAKEETIKSLNSTVESTNTEKTDLETKFNDLTDKLTSLNSMVDNMKPIVDKYNQEQYEKSLNEMKSTYEKKFKSVNALDKFEEEEVQELIKKSLNKNEEGQKAITQLNKMVVDAITLPEEESKVEGMEISINSVTEPCTDSKDLRQDVDEFEAFFGFKK